jgi:Cap4 SAVED domain
MLVTYITKYSFDALKRQDLDENDQNALFIEARDLFRKSPASGQVGELLVYFLLEAVMKAPQALRKMTLTTNPAEERKGSDGVHIRWNSDLQILEIYFAEAKIWRDFPAALKNAFESIQEFHATGMKQHELNLFSTHLRILDSDLQTKVLSYIEGENSPNTRINHACLIGFDWAEYKRLDDSRRSAFIAEFEQRYAKWGQAALTKTESHLSTFPHKSLGFEFFFIPFKDVQEFRDRFNEALRG